MSASSALERATRPHGLALQGAIANAPTPLPASEEPIETARAAGLHYVTDSVPGISRRPWGERFVYISPEGKPIRGAADLSRFQSLGIPPAWTDVWICPSPRGHLQATGRDAKGRKQYLYHPLWREVRDQTKFARLISFAEALPKIRTCVEQDLARPGLPREKVLAVVVRLLERTMIRIGNEEYARQNHHFGLTTMRNRHVDVAGATLRFHFRGKSGKKHEVEIHDHRLARIVRCCREIPGHHLFEYLDESDQCHAIDSGDVNDYLREITGEEFTAKDFRTWAGTLLAVRALRECGVCDTTAQGKKNLVRAVDAVREQLGNTRAVCQKYYVHPAVIEAYLDGSLLDLCRFPEPNSSPSTRESAGTSVELSSEEAALQSFLKRRAEGAAGG